MEYASILLEVAAFFLITLDLYGEQRLEHLHNRLQSIQESLQTRLSRLGQTTQAIDMFFQRLKHNLRNLMVLISTACALYVVFLGKAL